MNIKVKLTSTIKDLAGYGEVTIRCTGKVTVAELLDILVKQFGEKIIGKSNEYQWLHHGADYIVIAINDVVVDSEKLNQIEIDDGDILTLLPAISGG